LLTVGFLSNALTHMFHKKKQAISRILYISEKSESLIIYLVEPLLTQSICLPSDSNEPPSGIGLFGIAPHRVYLISLQHYLYILSVALVLIFPIAQKNGRALPAMLPFGVRTFLHADGVAIRKPADSKGSQSALYLIIE